MVIKPPRNWVRELFSVRGTILVESLPQITITTVVAFLVTMSEHYVELGAFDLTPVPFSLTGVAIGIFLGFRGKTAYDRFWEGRIQWGGLDQLLSQFRAPNSYPAGVPGRPGGGASEVAG